MYPRQQHTVHSIDSHRSRMEAEKGSPEKGNEDSLLKKYLRIFAVVTLYWY